MEHPGVRIINIKDPTGLIILGPRTAAASELWAPVTIMRQNRTWRGSGAGGGPLLEVLAQKGEKERCQEEMTVWKRVDATQPCPLCQGSTLASPNLV